MLVRWVVAVAILAVGGVADAAVPVPEPKPLPARPMTEKGPTEIWLPMAEAMDRLGLTDLQRRILAEVFHQYTYETPAAPAGTAFAIDVATTVPGGLYRMGPGGDLPARLTVRVRGAGASRLPIRLRHLVQDFYGRKVAGEDRPRLFPDDAGQATAELVIPEATAAGYYHVLVTGTRDGRSVTGVCGFAVVRPPLQGENPDSAVGLMAPPGEAAGALLPLAKRLGVRHLAFEWADGQATLEAVRGAGLVPWPVVSVPIPQRRPAPEVFASTTAEAMAPLTQAVPGWHLGGRPVFDPDDLAGSAISYRRSVSGLLEAVRRGGSAAALWVGTTPAILADVLTEGPVLAGADGVVLHVDAGGAEPSLRSGAYRRMVDLGVQTARRMNVTRVAVVTPADEPGATSPQQRAWKLITRHVTALAAGAEQVFIQGGRGLPAPYSSAAAYAMMTSLLGDARYEGDAWADVPLLDGHLFATPEQRVAVVWSWVGREAADNRGVLVFDKGLGLSAMDVVGHPIGIWKGERFILPLSEAPIYLVSVDHSVKALREQLRAAQVVGIAPATVHLRSIVRGRSPGKAEVTLWVQSHRPRKLSGRAGLLVPEGWTVSEKKRRFDLEPGAAAEVTFACEMPDDAGPPPYAMEAVVSLDEEFVSRRQNVWMAQAPQRTIEVGYGLDDWGGIRPVVLATADGAVRAEVRTAWDSEAFYVAVRVRRKRPTFQAGALAFDGDAVQLAWGIGPRADDDFGHPARGRALPVGVFRDTDHLMALTFGADGAQVIRLRRPRVTLRAHVPGNQDPWYGPVEGGQAAIARDNATGCTVYEAAIPWDQLTPLAGKRGRTFRFGVRVGNGAEPPLAWSQTVGVPEFLANPSSFFPLSASTLPCQTWWSLVDATE